MLNVNVQRSSNVRHWSPYFVAFSAETAQNQRQSMADVVEQIWKFVYTTMIYNQVCCKKCPTAKCAASLVFLLVLQTHRHAYFSCFDCDAPGRQKKWRYWKERVFKYFCATLTVRRLQIKTNPTPAFALVSCCNQFSESSAKRKWWKKTPATFRSCLVFQGFFESGHIVNVFWATMLMYGDRNVATLLTQDIEIYVYIDRYENVYADGSTNGPYFWRFRIQDWAVPCVQEWVRCCQNLRMPAFAVFDEWFWQVSETSTQIVVRSFWAIVLENRSPSKCRSDFLQFVLQVFFLAQGNFLLLPRMAPITSTWGDENCMFSGVS